MGLRGTTNRLLQVHSYLAKIRWWYFISGKRKHHVLAELLMFGQSMHHLGGGRGSCPSFVSALRVPLSALTQADSHQHPGSGHLSAQMFGFSSHPLSWIPSTFFVALFCIFESHPAVLGDHSRRAQGILCARDWARVSFAQTSVLTLYCLSGVAHHKYYVLLLGFCFLCFYIF